MVRGNGKSALLGAMILAAILYSSGTNLTTILVWLGVIVAIAVAIFLFEHRVSSVELTPNNLFHFTYFRLGLGVARGVIGQILLKEMLKSEIEEHKEAKAVIDYLANHDYLTNVANRRYFDKKTEALLQNKITNQSGVGLILIDLDNFKPINDNYGHAIGDKLLQKVASVMSQEIGDSGLVARVGGDEFSIVLYSCQNLEEMKKIVPTKGSKWAK